MSGIMFSLFVVIFFIVVLGNIYSVYLYSILLAVKDNKKVLIGFYNGHALKGRELIIIRILLINLF